MTMKKATSLFVFLLSFTLCAYGLQISLTFPEPHRPLVPYALAEKIARLKASSSWDVRSFGEPVPMLDPSGNLNAYLFCFSFIDDEFPQFDELLQPENLPPTDVWHRGEYGYVIVSATRYLPPILDLADCLPPYYATLSRAFGVAKKALSDESPALTGMFFLSPASVWFRFSGERGDIYIDAFRVSHTATQMRWDKMTSKWKLPDVEHPAWRNIGEDVDERLFRTIDYGYIDGVPAYLWSYGCAPTSSAMIFGYWNDRGYGTLIDYFFDHYDVITHSTVPDVPNVQQELAIAMETDTLHTGGTDPYNMPSAHIEVANELNGYSFDSHISPEGTRDNDYNWDWIVDEINVYNRPFVWCVLSYYVSGVGAINHATTAYGFEVDVAGDSMVILYNTWDYGEHHWPLYTLGTACPCDDSWDLVVTIEPSGGSGINVMFTNPSDGENLLGLMDYEITWEWTDSLDLIDHICIDYTTDNGETWIVITPSTPNDGSYMWTVPEIDTSRIIKMRIRAFAEDSTLLAVNATGNLFLLASSNVSCVSYLPVGLAYTEHSDVMVQGSLLFTADYTNGVGKVDISDPTHPVERARHFDCHGDAVALWVKDSLIFVASYSTTAGGMVVLNINCSHSDTVPTSPITSDTIAEVFWYTDIHKAMDIQVQGDYAYLVDADWGLKILDVSDPESPHLVGYWGNYSPATYQGIFVDGDYAYLTMGYQGVKVLDVSSPSDILEVGSYDTDGYAIRCYKRDEILYVADGWFGDLLLLDVSDPEAPELLGSYNTGGYVRDVKSNGVRAFLADMSEGFICLDVTDPTSISRAGFMRIGGSAQAVDFSDTLAFLTARNDGLYIIDFSDIASVEELSGTSKPKEVRILLSPNPFNTSQKIDILCPVGHSIISVNVYSQDGRCVRTLKASDEKKNTTKQQMLTITWDGRDDSGIQLPSGVYLISVRTEGEMHCRKTLLLK